MRYVYLVQFSAAPPVGDDGYDEDDCESSEVVAIHTTPLSADRAAREFIRSGIGRPYAPRDPRDLRVSSDDGLYEGGWTLKGRRNERNGWGRVWVERIQLEGPNLEAGERDKSDLEVEEEKKRVEREKEKVEKERRDAKASKRGAKKDVYDLGPPRKRTRGEFGC